MNLTFILLYLLLFTSFFVISSGNPLDRIVAHAHVHGGQLHACPQNTCKMDPATKLYFWIRNGARAPPNMFLRTQSRGHTIPITTKVVTDTKSIPRLTKKLKTELLERGDGHDLQLLQATFPNDQMEETTYTFLLTNDYRSWIAVDMTCEYIHRFLEPFRRGRKMNCWINKDEWLDTTS